MSKKTIDPIDLKIKLLQAGIKQKDVALRANVDKTTVCKVISGATKSKRILQIIQEMIKEKS
jgi:predicted transcriptional regulator